MKSTLLKDASVLPVKLHAELLQQTALVDPHTIRSCHEIRTKKGENYYTKFFTKIRTKNLYSETLHPKSFEQIYHVQTKLTSDVGATPAPHNAAFWNAVCQINLIYASLVNNMNMAEARKRYIPFGLMAENSAGWR